MTWDTSTLLAAATMLVGCGALGAAVPAVLRRLPEPEPAAEAEEADVPAVPTDAGIGEVEPESRRKLPPAPPKEPYVVMAGLPHLALKTALAAGVIGAVCGLVVGWTGALLVLGYVVPVGVGLALVDWRTTLLPTRVIAPSYAVVVALVLVAALVDHDVQALLRAGYGWLVWGGLFFVLWFVHPRGMGYGDVRLSGLLGLALGYLGWQQTLVGVYAAFLLGGLGGLLLSLLRIVNRKRYPFGPFMLLGALVGVLCGSWLMSGLGY